MPSMPNSSMPEPAAPSPAALGPAAAGAMPPPEIGGWRWAPVWILAYVALLFAPGFAEAVLSLG
ncbi:hypothetical protein KJE23_09700, partial [Streptococcus salivarius]|nr:hypothetical protein [Streptococcus salivarius]